MEQKRSIKNRPLRKFYVSSGSHEMVVSAHDLKGACCFMMNRVLGPVIKERTVEESLSDIRRAVLTFGDSFSLSESGMGKSEAGMFDTAEILDMYLGLMRAIDNLF